MVLPLFTPQADDESSKCIIATRMTRDDENTWNNTRSCLGGNPDLDRIQWPLRMHCIVQLDLSEVADLGLNSALPKEGGLVFFANTGSFTGWPHLGAVIHVPADKLGDFEPPTFLSPPYGEDWDSYFAAVGACSRNDAPTSFPRWPLTFISAEQSQSDENENGSYHPSLDDLLGPQAESVHFPLEGIVSGKMRERYWYPDEDASPFPVRAAQLLLNEAVRLARNSFISVRATKPDAAASCLASMRARMAEAEANLPMLERWSAILAQLDPDATLGPIHGPAFTAEIVTALKSSKGTVSVGAGTTMTGDAALHVYFDMYRGSRKSFESLPDPVLDYLETFRMRSAFSSGTPHQIGGVGANIQESDMLDRGMVLLMQVATDEAVGFEWGDVGVLQYWISPEDLQNGAWDKVEFLMHGH